MSKEKIISFDGDEEIVFRPVKTSKLQYIKILIIAYKKKIRQLIIYIKYKLGYFDKDILKSYCEKVYYDVHLGLSYIDLINSKYTKIDEFILFMCVADITRCNMRELTKYDFEKYVGSWLDIERQEIVTDETTINLLNMMI